MTINSCGLMLVVLLTLPLSWATVDAQQEPPVPALLGPTCGSQRASAPVYSWSHVGAAYYWIDAWKVGVPPPEGWVVRNVMAAADVCAGSTCSYAPGLPILAGSYGFHVIAKNQPDPGGSPSGDCAFSVVAPHRR